MSVKFPTEYTYIGDDSEIGQLFNKYEANKWNITIKGHGQFCNIETKEKLIVKELTGFIVKKWSIVLPKFNNSTN